MTEYGTHKTPCASIFLHGMYFGTSMQECPQCQAGESFWSLILENGQMVLAHDSEIGEPETEDERKDAEI